MPIRLERVGVVSLGSIITQETPTPATDGAQLVFTITNPCQPGTLEVFMDGVRQLPVTDFDETTTTTFTMTFAPDTAENLRVDYIKQ